MNVHIRHGRWSASLAAVLLLAIAAPPAAADQAGGPDAADLEFFERRVRPVLAANCYECHGPDKRESGLRLDHIGTILTGGERGPAVLPGSPDDSLLIEAVRYANVNLQMPPRSRLTDREVEDLARWVETGAPWPEEPRPAEGAGYEERFDLERRKAEHWAWQPVRAAEPPAVEHEGRVANAIDRFILARLEAEALSPAPPADRRTLIRRVYFDLIGLPPSPDEVRAFLDDSSPDAYEKVVDRLLASEHFGERWARHWMDLVRYSETYGHEFDYPINDAWQYRDYLIRALNDDVPYDRLVTEHIAGDLLDEPRPHPTHGYDESIVGTAFWYFGEQAHGPVDVREHLADRVDNQIDVMTKAFVGLTVSCARCHDHKFDAISTEDFYALAGFLHSSRRQDALLDPHGRIARRAGELKTIRAEASAALRGAVPRPSEAEAERFARNLSAARRVWAGEAAEEIAGEGRLDVADLRRWVAALEDEAVGRASYPLHPWAVAARGSEGPPDEPFAQRWARVQEGLDEEARRAEEAADRSQLFEGFTGGDFAQWYVEGEAFGDGPTPPGEWDAANGADTPRFAPPQVAHSGMLARQLRGAMRSRTFTIDSDYVHYRLAGRGGRIRLIVDGYTMDVFSDVLFGGLTFDVNTEDQFLWHAQDVSKYRGHRAHIEIIDDGDGYIAVDRIVFSDGPDPPAGAPDCSVAARLSAAGDASPGDLATAYGALWSDALEALHAGTADAAAVTLLDWALEHGLIDLNERAGRLGTHARRMAEVAADLPAPIRAPAIADGSGIDEPVYLRGNHNDPGQPAARRFLEAIAGGDQPAIPPHTSGRLQLARRVTDPGNALFPRVLVNRAWHHLFGRGIVPTVDNLGALGQPPSHPQLLDYLAGRFTGDGYSLKRLIRAIVTSNTYRASSATGGPGDRIDPENTLLHRMPIRRLEAEAIRDAILAVSGELDPRVGGPSVPVHLTEFMEGRGRPPESGPLDGDGRRSVYIEVRRNFLPPMMLAFDFPIPFSTMGRRSVSNVPAQALILLNDPFVVRQAERWAERARADPNRAPEQRVTAMYEAAFARPPDDAELAEALAFLDEQAAAHELTGSPAADGIKPWADLAHVLFNLKEFIFIE